MKKKLIDELRCPECKSQVAFDGTNEADFIEDGILYCQKCIGKFPILRGIPRFVPAENYAASFGFQWNEFPKTFLDTENDTKLSRDRFFFVTNWNGKLKGKKVLEVGCGMGRFTTIVAEAGAEVYTFDYSNAIEANRKNNGRFQNVHFLQADIFKIPFPEKTFDYIFCLGVLQHTPNVEHAFKSLIPYLKDGGEVAVDVYDLTIRTFFNLKYWIRPFTRRMAHQKLFRLIKRVVPVLFPIKMWITEKFAPVGKYIAFFIPIAYHKGFIPQCDDLTYDQLLEWSIVDTFDKYAPAYDHPQTKRTVQRWFKEMHMSDIMVEYGPNGIIAKGRK